MKYLLILFSLISFAYAQEPAYTPMRLNYQFRGIKVDSLFLVPSFTDTTSANTSTIKNVAGAMIRCGNDFWMRNATTTSWLQNINVGEGSSPSVQFVDSIYRVVGKDSIFWRKAGNEFAIKDSTGGGGTDSPDRINGTATGPVTADMDNNNIRFSNVDQFAVEVAEEIKLEGYQTILQGANITQRIDTNEFSIKDFDNTLLTLDTLGNIELGNANEKARIEVSQQDTIIRFYSSEPMEWKDKAFGIKSQVKTGFADNGIDLSLGSYVIKVPGVYVIPTSDATNDISLPDAAIWAGQSVQIINNDAGQDANLITQGAATIWDRGQVSTINKVNAQQIGVFYSDGQDWYGFKL
jgi:hypothetical protein